MATPNDLKNTKSLTRMYKQGYSFQAPDGKLRTGALLVRADSPTAAQNEARHKLAKEFDWFKLTKTLEYEGDHPQQQL